MKLGFIKTNLLALLALSIGCSPLVAATRTENEQIFTKSIAEKALVIADVKQEIASIQAELESIENIEPRSGEEKNALRARKKELETSLKKLNKSLEKLEDFSELGDSTFSKIKSWIAAHPYLTTTAIVTTIATIAGGAYMMKYYWGNGQPATVNQSNTNKDENDRTIRTRLIELKKVYNEMASQHTELRKQLPTEVEQKQDEKFREQVFAKWATLEKAALGHQAMAKELLDKTPAETISSETYDSLNSYFFNTNRFVPYLQDILYRPDDDNPYAKSFDHSLFKNYATWKQKQAE